MRELKNSGIKITADTNKHVWLCTHTSINDFYKIKERGYVSSGVIATSTPTSNKYGPITLVIHTNYNNIEPIYTKYNKVLLYRINTDLTFVETTNTFGHGRKNLNTIYYIKRRVTGWKDY